MGEYKKTQRRPKSKPKFEPPIDEKCVDLFIGEVCIGKFRDISITRDSTNFGPFAKIFPTSQKYNGILECNPKIIPILQNAIGKEQNFTFALSGGTKLIKYEGKAWIDTIETQPSKLNQQTINVTLEIQQCEEFQRTECDLPKEISPTQESNQNTGKETGAIYRKTQRASKSTPQ